jgi:hypothetical protein
MSLKEPEHEFEAGDVVWDDTLKSDLLQCKVCQLPASAKVHGHAVGPELPAHELGLIFPAHDSYHPRPCRLDEKGDCIPYFEAVNRMAEAAANDQKPNGAVLEAEPVLFEDDCRPESEDKLLYRIEMAYGAAERGQFFDCEKWLGDAIVASQEKRQAIREAEAKASGKIP